MFEFLFKYPATVFARGNFVFLAGWPGWVLALAVVAAAAALAWPWWHGRRDSLTLGRRAVLWSLQAGFVGLLLLMLWQPALSVSTLRPQQNIVAVVVDDSRSMSTAEPDGTRRDQARNLLRSGLLDRLNERFQVRLYRASAALERIHAPDQLAGNGPSTRLASALEHIADEAGSLPIGGVVLVSDGAENAGGIGLETVDLLKRRHLPVHTVGIGRERMNRDIELASVDLPQRAIAESRVAVDVGLRQYGYTTSRARIRVTHNNATLASKDVDLRKEGEVENFTLIANVGSAGAKTLRIGIEPLSGEENKANNAVDRLLSVDARKPRILYIEGEPRWEFKFIRRAAELDQQLELVSMLRTTQNKVYRQGIGGATELAEGFPAQPEELFAYDGLIIGGVEAAYFTPAQHELIRQFADRRGGGVLFLGGRGALADGGWGQSPAAEMMPVILPNRKDTFKRDPANVDLTNAGRDSIVCRIEEDPSRNAERWRKMPFLANYQDPGAPKAGALVLAEMQPVGGRRMPLLITQNFGRGRTGVFATGGSWRWQMQQPLADTSHETFWQQMLRWLVASATPPVVVSSSRSVYTDESRIRLSAVVRDKSFQPALGARVQAQILAPGGSSQTVDLRPDPQNPGVYIADADAPAAGSYVSEAVAYSGEQELGRDSISFLREDGVAENFHIEQNRELLEKLAAATGGRYYTTRDTSRIPDEIAFSEAGISTRETRNLWNMPIFFILALTLRSAEWTLRRKWGTV